MSRVKDAAAELEVGSYARLCYWFAQILGWSFLDASELRQALATDEGGVFVTEALREFVSAYEAHVPQQHDAIAALGREKAVLEGMVHYLAQCLHMRTPEHSTRWLEEGARKVIEEDMADEAAVGGAKGEAK